MVWHHLTEASLLARWWTPDDLRVSELVVHYRITDSTVDSADFIAGIEIGFGQSLDRLAATLTADSRTDSTDDTEHDTDTRSTK